MNLDLNIYKSKKIFVTGDSGFKGSWLSIWLLMLGAEITGYSLEPRTAGDNYCICGLKDKYHRINADVRDYDRLSNEINKFKPDFIFHLAAQPLVLDSYQIPRETFDINVIGTLNVLEAARKTDSVRTVIVVTSDKCYDNKETIYAYREIDALGGKDPYSASKGAAEIITASYAASFFSGPDTAAVASVRAGNVFGGGDWAPNRIFPDCIRSISEDREIQVRNPGAVRPWQHVLEPLAGYLDLGSALYNNKLKYTGAWNFGPYYDNIKQVGVLVKYIIEAAGRGSAAYSAQLSSRSEAGLLYLDIAKSINYLGWRPVFDLKQAVALAVEEYYGAAACGTPEETFSQRVEHIKKYIENRAIKKIE